MNLLWGLSCSDKTYCSCALSLTCRFNKGSLLKIVWFIPAVVLYTQYGDPWCPL